MRDFLSKFEIPIKMCIYNVYIYIYTTVFAGHNRCSQLGLLTTEHDFSLWLSFIVSRYLLLKKDVLVDK